MTGFESSILNAGPTVTAHLKNLGLLFVAKTRVCSSPQEHICAFTIGTAFRRFAFSLRTLILVVVAVGAALGWRVNRAQTQRRAVALILALCGGMAL